MIDWPLQASAYICRYLQRQPRSAVASAMQAKDDARAEKMEKAAAKAAEAAREFAPRADTQRPSFGPESARDEDKVCH